MKRRNPFMLLLIYVYALMLAHLHHFMDYIRSGRPVKDAVLIVGTPTTH